MKVLACISASLWLLVSFPVFAQTLTIHVTYPDGSPAEGVKVQEFQLERYQNYNQLLGKTDRTGTIQIRFRREPAEWRNELKGYGIYRFLIMPEEHPWVLSDLYYWNEAERNEFHSPWDYASYGKIIEEKEKENAPSNWRYVRLLEIKPDSVLDWNAELPQSNSYEVRAVDQFGEPVSNFEIAVSIDLEARTHTGGGAVLNLCSITTDGDGMFTLRNMGDCYYRFDSSNYFQYYTPGLSYRTGCVFHRFDKENNRIVFKKSVGGEITVYAIDRDTQKPLEGVWVGQVMSFDCASQGGPIGKTDKEGKYFSTDFNPEQVGQFHVWHDGYETEFRDISQYTPGGMYVFELIKSATDSNK
ncbi:MAG: hypothetical protein ABIH23_24740 [bacterium]